MPPSKYHTSSQYELRRMSPEERFWLKVEKTETCWIWHGGHKSNGYGQFKASTHTRQQRAHRYIYELTYGPIPCELQIDHICRVKACVRPNHLRVATPSQNSRNRPSTDAKQKRLQEGICLYGHNLSLYWNDQYQRCWQCHRDRSRKSMTKKRRRLGIPER